MPYNCGCTGCGAKRLGCDPSQMVTNPTGQPCCPDNRDCLNNTGIYAGGADGSSGPGANIGLEYQQPDSGGWVLLAAVVGVAVAASGR